MRGFIRAHQSGKNLALSSSRLNISRPGTGLPLTRPGDLRDEHKVPPPGPPPASHSRGALPSPQKLASCPSPGPVPRTRFLVLDLSPGKLRRGATPAAILSPLLRLPHLPRSLCPFWARPSDRSGDSLGPEGRVTAGLGGTDGPRLCFFFLGPESALEHQAQSSPAAPRAPPNTHPRGDP